MYVVIPHMAGSDNHCVLKPDASLGVAPPHLSTRESAGGRYHEDLSLCGMLPQRRFLMSRLRVLICRVDADDDEQMTELARVDLPAVPGQWGDALDRLEAQVTTAGQRLLGRLCELQWEEVDAQAVARYCADAPPGSV